jgi:hypothetical protein
MKLTTSSQWFTPWRFAAMLALLITVCFPSVLFGFESFVYGDTALFSYPVALHYRECFWRGEIPLWNPLNSCGIPFLAEWNTLTLYPPSLFYLLFPMPWSFGVFCLGHIFFAGLGMYFLARDWTGSGLAAAVAGTAFAFNGLIWQGLMWPHLLAALAWMPWLVLAMEKAWRDGGRFVVLTTLIGAMQMLSGGVEVIVLTWVVLGVLWLWQLIRGDLSRTKLVLRFACIVVWVAGLSAIQIFPFLDLLRHSQRTGNYGSGGMAGIEAMPLSGVANFLVPLFHCVRNPQGVFTQIDQGWVASYFIGVGIVAFALFAAWRVRNQRVWILAGLTVFSLFMALGERGFVYDIAKRLVPIFGFIRFPVKFVALAAFTFPLLAAFGVNRLNTASAESWPREWRFAKRLALGIIVSITVILWFAWKYPVAGEEFVAISRNAAVRLLILALIFGCVAWLRWNAETKIQVLGQSAIIVLLWADVFTHTPNLSPSAPGAVLKAGAIREFFGWKNELNAGSSRAIQSKDSLWKTVSSGSSDPAQDVTMRRVSLSMNLNLLDDVPKFDGFYSVDIKEHLDIFKRVFFTTNDAPKLLDFLAVSHISDPTNVFGWIKRDSFMPLVTAGQVPAFGSDADVLDTLFSDQFEPSRTVYLPLEAEGKIHVAKDTNARIVSTHFSSQHIEIEAEADKPAMVVVAQTFYHPWHAYVDGVRTELWRANHAFQALEIPAGRHQVKLVYEDIAFRLGVAVSLVSLLACIAGWLWQRRKVSVAPTG